MKHILEIIDLLDDARVNGLRVKEFFDSRSLTEYIDVNIETIKGDRGSTDFVSIRIPGIKGKSSDGDAPTLGVIGRLGGIGARPAYLGLTSDADGAIVALAVAYKIAEMSKRGDRLPGDVVVSTHICPNAPVRPAKPVPMMDSPVGIFDLLVRETAGELDAVLSIDATKANWVVKQTGFAITPTVKDGWILKVSQDLINVYVRVTGEPPVIVPITMQDILPFSTPVYHINSIMQPWLYTSAPVVGVAITARMALPGSGTGSTNIYALELAARFVVEVAKDYTMGRVRFYDEEEWDTIIKMHGHVREIMSRGAPGG